MASVTNTFWPSFNDQELYEEVLDTFTESVAAQVVAAFGLQCESTEIGGSLSTLDIKHMDALQLIKISLLQASIKNSSGPYEAYVNYSNNSIEFREVGKEDANVTDEYFNVQTYSYVEECSGVMIYGGKPLIRRLDEKDQVVWVSIFGDGPKQIYDVTAMTSNCHKVGFSSTVIIVYKDPNLNSEYKDNIDNLYEINDPWLRLIGYARMINAPGRKDNTTITHSRQSSVPIKVPDAIETLIRPPYVSSGEAQLGSDCWAVHDMEVDGGVEIVINSDFRYTTKYGTVQDTFIGISKVFVVGLELTQCGSKPKDKDAMIKALTGDDTESDHEVWVSINDIQLKTIALRENIDYVVNYLDGENPRIQFANNARPYDKAKYGKDVTYKVNPICKYGDGETKTEVGTILPQGDSGILVREVWVMADLEVPSIIIYDPNGEARKIADDLEYMLKPLVLYELPPPIGFNGEIIDQSKDIPDRDPLSHQAFENTPLENALLQLDGGGGLTLNLSFLYEEEEVKALSNVLWNYMNSGTGVETVYTCGPDCNPLLGGYHTAGGVINKIVHSFTDSSAYTVSVYEGNRLILDTDLVGISGGPYFKKTESPSMRGIVISDLGNHIHYKVRIDGFGEQIAINCQPEILRVGDQVTCTIHNNPVEQ